MKLLIVTLCVVLGFSGVSAETPSWQPSSGHTQVPIWPGTVPDAQPFSGPEIFGNTGSTEFRLHINRQTAGIFQRLQLTAKVVLLQEGRYALGRSWDALRSRWGLLSRQDRE